MSKHNIIVKGTSQVRCMATEVTYSGTFMEVPHLDVTVVSAVPITFEIGDYIDYDYDGIRYTLRSEPEVLKQSSAGSYGEAFRYTLIFSHPLWELEHTMFMDIVPNDNIHHFTSMPSVDTYEDVYGIAGRIQANIDLVYPERWVISVVGGLDPHSALLAALKEPKNFSVSNSTCLDALSEIYNLWKVSFITYSENGLMHVMIGRAETHSQTTDVFRYGKGEGALSITRTVANGDDIVTRLYVYGSTRNLNHRHYNDVYEYGLIDSMPWRMGGSQPVIGESMYIPNLMIPLSRWGHSSWVVWQDTSSDTDNMLFTAPSPKVGDYAYTSPNDASARCLITQVTYSVTSATQDTITIDSGKTYTRAIASQVQFHNVKTAYIDAPQEYMDKYGVRAKAVYFDGSDDYEEIYPSVKEMTIGQIRAAMSEEEEYYPSKTIYTDDSQRVDTVLECIDEDSDNSVFFFEETLEIPWITHPFECTADESSFRIFLTTLIAADYILFKLPSEIRVSLGGSIPLKYTAMYTLSFSLNVSLRLTDDDYQSLRQFVSLHYIVEVHQVNKLLGDETIYSCGVSKEGVSTHIIKDKSSYEDDTFEVIVRLKEYSFYIPAERATGMNAECKLIVTSPQPMTIINPDGTIIELPDKIIKADIGYSSLATIKDGVWFRVRQLGFDIMDYAGSATEDDTPRISMTSGQCGGYEFEIKNTEYDPTTDTWLIACSKYEDTTLKMSFPNDIYKINADASNPDTFVLLGITMPYVYINAAEQRLYDKACALELYKERYVIEPKIDSKVMAVEGRVLQPGMWFAVEDSDLGLTGEGSEAFSILVNELTIKDTAEALREFSVSLRNEKEDSYFVRAGRAFAETVVIEGSDPLVPVRRALQEQGTLKVNMRIASTDRTYITSDNEVFIPEDLCRQVHDHNGQLIRPDVFVIPSSAPSDSTAMATEEYALYITDTTEAGGEDPTISSLEISVSKGKDADGNTNYIITQGTTPKEPITIWSPKWYGYITKEGIPTRLGGNVGINVIRPTTGIYNIQAPSLDLDQCVIQATAGQYNETFPMSSPIHYTANVASRNGTVVIFTSDGTDFADCAIWLTIM